VLDTLAPIERAVFVLREVLDLGYDEIAEAVDKTPGARHRLGDRWVR
jgi:DNA-directed RNA polymerase specialized sigma24 family protein